MRIFLSSLLCACLLACGSGPDSASVSDDGYQQQQKLVYEELNTIISECVQVDQVGDGPHDANVVAGEDPADSTVSVDFPTCQSATYIDWDDLSPLSNHRLLDLDNEKGVDLSSFPRSNECVAGSHVLSKMDLTYVAAANNTDYAYLAVQRSGNNGDAAYAWLFTRDEPGLEQGAGPCRPGESQLTYDVSPGDVLMIGHFHPSDDAPLLRVFTATADAHVTAVEAIDYTSSLWVEQPHLLAAAAVNTTITSPGALGSAGVKSMDGDNLDIELFAEVAVDLELFTGAGSALCGAKFYGTVITRSSGSGGTSPDLKDLAGPARFNFGEMVAMAALTPSCDSTAGYGLTSVTGFGGATVENPVCTWGFTDGSTSGDCAGVLSVDPGLIGGTVQVSDPATQCSVTVDAASVEVLAPLSVGLDLTAQAAVCAGDDATYVANVSGGSGDVSYQWNGVACEGTSCTINPEDSLMCGSVDVSVTVTDSNQLCGSATSETETYTKQTVITASDN